MRDRLLDATYAAFAERRELLSQLIRVPGLVGVDPQVHTRSYPVANLLQPGPIIVARRPNIGEPDLILTMAHEFFHTLQQAHNWEIAFGFKGTPYSADFDTLTFSEFWFVEATATWVESYLYRDQIDVYRRLADSHPDKFRLVASGTELVAGIDHWSGPAGEEEGHPVGMIYLMEGADGIRSPGELSGWYDLGLRIVGLAWAGTRYAGGTSEPGPLTDEGRKLLAAMSDYNFILDLSHMDEAAATQALDRYEGPVIATHSNCAALMKG